MKKIGLLGGSFNPAHGGHRAISLFARDALGLDEIWWLVSPGNPLKPARGMAPLPVRLAHAQKIARRAPIRATAIERQLGTRYTVDSLRALRQRYPRNRFVWLMGADNLLQLPRWARWRQITREVPLAVYPRPGFTLKARLSPVAAMLKSTTLEASDAALLADIAPPVLTFLEGREHEASATAIRAARSGENES